MVCRLFLGSTMGLESVVGEFGVSGWLGVLSVSWKKRLC